MSGVKYASLNDQELTQETEKRFKAMRMLLLEIRDLLRAASGPE